MNRSHRRAFPAFFVLLALLMPLQRARAVTPLKDGDRVVFYGDSITQQRLYTRYLQQYVYCRYPELKVRFYNAGWSGDTAPGGLKRLERDVLALDPTVVTLLFGMNDGRYTTVNEENLGAYRQGMEGIIKALQAKKVRVIVFSPGCVDYDTRPALREVDYNKTLQALAGVAQELAGKHQCEFVDVHGPMLQFQTEQKVKDKAFTMIPDGVHPDAKGQLVMARTMLTAFAEPMAALPPLEAGGATSWKVRTALPFWIDPASLSVAEASGMIGLACPKLAIKGLKPATYELTAGGAVVGRFSADQLSAGVPLSAGTAPAQRLHDVLSVKEDHYFRAWRDVQIPLADEPASKKVVAAMLQSDEALQDLIRAISAPVELDLAVHARPEGKNLALKKPYETSDPNTHKWGIGGLTDGSWAATSKTCFATDAGRSFPKTVTIDLEKPETVATVVLGVPPFGSTKTITVSVSEDGNTFTDVGSHVFPQRKEDRRTFTFSPRQARYVRLTYPDRHTESAGYNPNFMFTTEVEVYGTAASAN